jgi:hypothetical protein
MPVFPSQNLNTQKICESYPKLLQIYSGSLVLDGTGSLIPFLNVTASYALNCNCGSGSGGSSLYTGSTYPITASWALNSLTASYASNFGNSITQSFSASNIWTFNHNLGDKYVLVQAVDVNDNQLIPEVINLFDENTALLGFSVPTAGTAIATRGGLRKLTIISGSANLCCLQTGSTYPITASWTLSASYAPCSCPLLQTGSIYPITASWALSAITSSYIQVTRVSYPVKRIYNNYTIVKTADYTLLCDATSGSFDVKLPNPSGNTNIYNIKKIDRTGHCINVTVTNASYIDYDVTQSICHRGTNMTVQSDGTNQYWIL